MVNAGGVSRADVAISAGKIVGPSPSLLSHSTTLSPLLLHHFLACSCHCLDTTANSEMRASISGPMARRNTHARGAGGERRAVGPSDRPSIPRR